MFDMENISILMYYMGKRINLKSVNCRLIGRVEDPPPFNTDLKKTFQCYSFPQSLPPIYPNQACVQIYIVGTGDTLARSYNVEEA